MTNDRRYTLYVLISALASGAGIVATEVLLRFFALSALEIVIPANAVGGLFLLLIAAVQGTRGWRGWPAIDWLRLLIASAATYALAFLLLYEALSRIGSSEVSLLGRLEVVFIVGLAVVFLGERWTLRHWIASALALVGAALVNFDPAALDLQIGLGEVLSVLAALSFSVGIVVLKSLVDRQDGQLVTGFGLLLGAALLTPFALHQDLAFTALREAGWWAALTLLGRGLLLGIAWVTYNIAMKHLGASRCTVMFLSVVVFTVAIQLMLNAMAPGLGLRVPGNLLTALLGGAVIGAAVFLLQRQD
jgi:drug/metabolite transporter (DMT)-like permease